MIEVLTQMAYALAFGLGASLTFFGFLLTYSIWDEKNMVNSQWIVTQIALLLSTIGISLMYFVVG